MALGKRDLERHVADGAITIPDHLPFRSFSLDVRLGNLYTLDDQRKNFFERLLPIDLTSFISEPGKQYWWTPIENFSLDPCIYAYGYSRSSWARLGVAARIARDTDDLFSSPYRAFHGLPWGVLTTAVPLHLQQGDAVAQVVFHDARWTDVVSAEEIRSVLENDLHVMRKETRVSDAPHGVPLSLDDEILIYRRGTIPPLDFEKIRIPPDGLQLSKGAFFLSASAERVEIPDAYVGKVDEHRGRSYLNEFVSDWKKEYAPPLFSSHANAPYIGPRSVFSGKITFENHMLRDGVIYPGMLLSHLYLERLSSCAAEKSRYAGQDTATSAKL